jgi:hypothetical protein
LEWGDDYYLLFEYGGGIGGGWRDVELFDYGSGDGV